MTQEDWQRFWGVVLVLSAIALAGFSGGIGYAIVERAFK